MPDAMRGYLGGTWGEHAARWDMTRALAECEAKRRIVERCQGAIDEQADICEYSGADVADFVVRALAAVYAAHPDYDPAWAPILSA